MLRPAFSGLKRERGQEVDPSVSLNHPKKGLLESKPRILAVSTPGFILKMEQIWRGKRVEGWIEGVVFGEKISVLYLLPYFFLFGGFLQ